MASHNDYGRWGEQKAAEYLEKKGYSILHRNWRTGRRDIDITAVTEDGETLAIVEVKTRHCTDLTKPEEAVDWRKMRNLVFAANSYVQRMGITLGIRFDIITVVGEGDTAYIDHIENAFVPPMNMR